VGVLLRGRDGAGPLQRHARLQARAQAAALPNFRLYDLRHTFATHQLAQGAPITYVDAQLGHSKPTTTLQWYAHWLPTARRAYVDALDAPGPVAESASASTAATASDHLCGRVPARHGTNRAPFQEMSKYAEGELIEKVGSPGWTRTSDILINWRARQHLALPIP
jgi:hypothetical protein